MLKGYRGKIFDFNHAANPENLADHFRFFEDGLLVVEDGWVKACGDFSRIKNSVDEEFEIVNFGASFIFPGFVDAHVHSVQTAAIASHGNELLDWLENYIFPNERNFENPDYALGHTRFFLKQLLKNGTTTAMVYPSVHENSAEALFQTAHEMNFRLITGNTWMDRNAPDYLLRSPQESYDSSVSLIKKWHKKGRLHFAATPRYAITSSPESLKVISTLMQEHRDLYLQTHISENKKEVAVVNHHYPNNNHYLDVYDSYGLLTPKTLLGHGIYLKDDELKRIAETGCSIVHCPSSNLFLGSGLFDYKKVLDNKINIALGSDVGAGTSFSMLQNLQDAYKISALTGKPLNPLLSFYFITLGGAKALHLDRKTGNFDNGKEADFVVIDPSLNELLDYRLKYADSLEEALFAIIILSGEQVVKNTFLMGKKV
jgi:guanine deaminase